MKDNRQMSIAEEAAEETALYRAVLALNNIDEAGRFFRDLCTPAELQALKDRWHVVGLLEQGLTYRDINRRTGISVTTIGRVNRFLEQGNDGYAIIRDRLKGSPKP